MTTMRIPGETELLALWERGLVRHPIDRALLLGAWARPELPASSLADLPLGSLNRALLDLRAALFGPRMDAYVDCERCGVRLAVPLDLGELRAACQHGDDRPETLVGGRRWRSPSTRDLAAAASEPDAVSAARRLLARCCLDPLPDVPESAGEWDAIESALEALDPAADLSLALVCETCGHRWDADLDLGALLWNEIDACARGLLAQVHDLASRYGWSEPEILALSPARRAAYRALLGA